MIFVTVGVSQPFPRLIKKMDDLAPRLDQRVFMQIGPTQYEPKNAEYVEFMDEETFQKYLLAADLLVGHAGTGTTLNAIRHRKKCVLVPRRQEYGEHANDHQLHHVKGWQQRVNIQIAYEMDELEELLLEKINDIPVPEISQPRETGLVKELRRAIEEG